MRLKVAAVVIVLVLGVTLLAQSGPPPTVDPRPSLAPALQLDKRDQEKREPTPAEIFAAAQAAKEDVEVWSQRVVEALLRIGILNQQFDTGELNLAPEKETIDEYRTVILPAMLKGAEEILDQRKDFDRNFDLYTQSIDHAIPALRDASEVWHRYATEETDREFQEHYFEGAKSIELWAATFQARQSRLNEMRREIDDKVAYVEKSALLLNRMDSLLSLYPKEMDAPEQIEAYLKRLETFQRQFRVLLKSFRDFSETFEEREKSAPAVNDQVSSENVRALPRIQKNHGMLHSVVTIAGRTFVTGRLPLQNADRLLLKRGNRLQVERQGESVGSVTIVESTRFGFTGQTFGFQPQSGDHVLLSI